MDLYTHLRTFMYVHLHTLYTLLQIDLTGSSCPTFSYSEYLQIYDAMRVYHLPAPVSKYCILYSLDRDIRTLTANEGHGLTIDIFPPCS